MASKFSQVPSDSSGNLFIHQALISSRKIYQAGARLPQTLYSTRWQNRPSQTGLVTMVRVFLITELVWHVWWASRSSDPLELAWPRNTCRISQRDTWKYCSETPSCYPHTAEKTCIHSPVLVLPELHGACSPWWRLHCKYPFVSAIWLEPVVLKIQKGQNQSQMLLWAINSRSSNNQHHTVPADLISSCLLVVSQPWSSAAGCLEAPFPVKLQAALFLLSCLHPKLSIHVRAGGDSGEISPKAQCWCCANGSGCVTQHKWKNNCSGHCECSTHPGSHRHCGGASMPRKPNDTMWSLVHSLLVPFSEMLLRF